MSLTALREAIAAGQTIDASQDIVALNGKEFKTSEPTIFTAQDPQPWKVDLKSVLHAWSTRSLSLADYIISCEENSVKNLKFAERADLLAWLEGKSDESEYIEEAQSQAAATGKRTVDDVYKMITAREVTLSDHNSILQGSKRIDFTSASKECHKLIMNEFRKHQKFSTSGSSSGSATSGSSKKLKEPIILLSPSPSALINMSNIADFLERGKFEPQTRSSSTSSFARLQRDSPQLGKMRFFVVDNVERFKPEYWDRVVAVFVTGQSWQLKPYKWSDPNQLFQNCMGFSVNYKGDPIPSALKGWNVALEEVERTKRFRDHEVVERIWERLENHMLARGWGKK